MKSWQSSAAILVAIIMTTSQTARAITIDVLSGSGSVTITRSNGETVSDAVVGGTYPHTANDIASATIGPVRTEPTASHGSFSVRQAAAAGAPTRSPLPPYLSTRIVAEVELFEGGTTAEAMTTFSYALSGGFAPNELVGFSIQQVISQALIRSEGAGVNITPDGAGNWGTDAYANVANSVEIWQDGILAWSSFLEGDSFSLASEAPAQRAWRLDSFPQFRADASTGFLNLQVVVSSTVNNAIAATDLYYFDAAAFADITVVSGSGVPDTGSTLALLGLALCGMAAARRFTKARCRVREPLREGLRDQR